LDRAHFYKNSQQKDGLAGKCRDCMAVLRKEWDRKYNASPKARATARRYYYSEKGQATKKAYRQAYELTDEQREKYRLTARMHEKLGKYKLRRKRYDQSPKGRITKMVKDKRYIKSERGRFSKRKVEIKRKYQMQATDCTLTRVQWLTIKEAWQHRCAYCNQESQRLEMDHAIPLSKGGDHTMSNIVPACRACNAKKGNR
jgi:5-methylcytosine-specific restriction endonuclease McrA